MRVRDEDIEFRGIIEVSRRVLDEGTKLEIILEENVVLQEAQSLLTRIGSNESGRLIVEDGMRREENSFESFVAITIARLNDATKRAVAWEHVFLL